MVNPQHLQWLKEGVDSWNDRRDKDDYYFADLHEAYLTNLNLQNAIFVDANLTGADFTNSDLRGANFTAASLVGANFTNAKLDGANLSDANLVDAKNLNQDMLEKASGTKDTALPYGLRRPENWNVQGDGLPGPLHYVWLRTSIKSWNRRRIEKPFQPDLRGAFFPHSDLTDANLSDADLTGANIEDAHCDGTNFRNSKLNGLSFASIVLSGADLSGADLTGAINLEQSRLNGAFGDHTTILPEGLEYPDHWPDVSEVSPLKRQSILDQVVSASPIDVIVKNGKIAVTDKILGIRSSDVISEDLNKRLSAQKELAGRICTELSELSHNLPNSVEEAMSYYHDRLTDSADNWYILDSSSKAIAYHIEKHGDEPWPGNVRPCLDELQKRHGQLARYYESNCLQNSQHNENLLPLDGSKLSSEVLQELTNKVNKLVESDEAAQILDGSAVNFLKHGTFLINNSSVNINNSPVDKSSSVTGILKWGLLSLAGFFGIVLSELSVNLLTARNAVPTFMENIKALWKLIEPFFM